MKGRRLGKGEGGAGRRERACSEGAGRRPGPGRAPSARRRAQSARAASRGAARVAQVEAGAGAGATPGLRLQPPGSARSSALLAGGRAGPGGAGEEAEAEAQRRGAGPARGGAERARAPPPPPLRAAELLRLRSVRRWGKLGRPRQAPRRGGLSGAREGVPAAGTRAGGARAVQPRWRRWTCKP